MKHSAVLGATALVFPLVAWLAFAQMPQEKQPATDFYKSSPGPVLGFELPDASQQDPKPGPELPKEQGGDKKQPPGPELKDPTAPSQKLKDVLNVGKGAIPGQAAMKIPNLVLRGRIISKDRPSTALVEMDGRLYVVGKDSVLPGPGGMTLRVDDINSLEVRIELAPFKEMLSLR